MHFLVFFPFWIVVELTGTEAHRTTENDVVLPLNRRVKRQFLVQNRPLDGRWPNNTVNYYFDEDSFDSSLRPSILQAMEKISSHTCIKFTTDPSEIMVRIISEYPDNCYAAIGRFQPDQPLNFVQRCYSVGLAAHELIHSLGFVHAHQRIDRDKYLIIPEDDEERDQFQRFENQQILVPYDYGSVMQYSNGGDQFYARDERYQSTMGSHIISFYDYLMINKVYDCTCETPITCKNEGYPNPANCSQCNCPYGFGGADCSELPENGQILEATNKFQFVNVSLDAGETQEKLPQIDFVYKYLWITAPPNKTIHVSLRESNGVKCTYGCILGGLEIKTEADPRITSPRVCCDEGYVSDGSHNNPTVVMIYNAKGISSYQLSYRYK